MKKFISLFLASIIVLSLGACGNTSNTTQSTPEVSQSPSVAPAMPQGGRPNGGGMGQGSIDTSSIKTKYTDVKYASVSDTQTLDIYLPNEGTAPFPVIIAIHGGAFMMGSKTGSDVQSMMEGVNHGYAVVSVNYRLSGEAIFPAAISDVKAAIRFIRANAKKYNLNADKIVAWGDSAGGNLASLVGTSNYIDTLNGDVSDNLEYSSKVQAVVDWFGPMDFTQMDEQFKQAGITPSTQPTNSDTSPESKYIGQNIMNDVSATQKANPETYITPDAPYFFIQHGSADKNVPTQQSINFASKLTQAIGKDKVTLDIIEGAAHGSSEFNTAENLAKVFAFIDGVVKK